MTYCLKNNNDTKKCRFKSVKMLSSKCVVCDSKKSQFLKEQEAKGLLSSLGIKIPRSNISLLEKILL